MVVYTPPSALLIVTTLLRGNLFWDALHPSAQVGCHLFGNKYIA
jgi:hypothetical protein